MHVEEGAHVRRIVQCEFNSYFFQLFGEHFLKSFYEHNKGWDLFVVDLGLETADRELLERYGTVKKYPVDPCSRWPNLTGRILSLHELLSNPDTLVLRFDTDGAFIRTYEDLVQDFLASGVDMAAAELPHSIADRARNLDECADILGVSIDDPCLYKLSTTACCMLLRSTPKLAKSFEWLSKHYEKLLFAAKEEEPAIGAVLYRDGITRQCWPWSHFWSIGMSEDKFTYMLPSLYPVNSEGARIRGIHYAFTKYFMLNSAALQSHMEWCGWKYLFDQKYNDMPWPDPDVVRQLGS